MINDIEKGLNERFEDFWDVIYSNEKEEIKRMKKYIDYVEETLRCYEPLTFTYDSFKILFMNKHLDYLKESFYSIVIKNYNGCAASIRMMIENYISFVLIKKYRKKELFKDWYLFGYQRYISMVDKEPYHSKILENYKKVCENLNLDISIFDGGESYSWLKRVVKLNYRIFIIY